MDTQKNCDIAMPREIWKQLNHYLQPHFVWSFTFDINGSAESCRRLDLAHVGKYPVWIEQMYYDCGRQETIVMESHEIIKVQHQDRGAIISYATNHDPILKMEPIEDEI